ncbi:acyl-CoA dehydrogenase family member 11-like [Tigriopus californicus]|uniref:acyl-CoA dehydrogenase family member 11-like n=1 Tax=Tigriopus californicus TaxID=6832 RepID=UPI0027DA23CE|nr:acyl-CoA dehydrogenase family member 11-like [Tigriopus californicus]|eukprot:TCALIF_08628-PA protein Name:"Similar to aidB Putative acyl-CoA dehydrogenase AidB (Escherichia coli (strain K12))" AED:0.03 eAED:0.03 QI:0/-1/0/1/-1/1/1/0/623
MYLRGALGIPYPVRWKSSAPPATTPWPKPALAARSIERLPYAKARTGIFVQEEPDWPNAYTSNPFVRRNLARLCPPPVLESIEPDLEGFGQRVSTDIWSLGRECEDNPPYLKQTNAWGRRVDEIVTCPAWRAQKAIAAQEGLVAIAYERNQAEYSRIYQAVKLFMYGPASGLYCCPLAMTDGAAQTLQAHQVDLPEAWAHLTSRDPAQFWTSGQWMTEKRGGSDVAHGTETLAVPTDQPGLFHLHGYKWFSSATDADMTLALARIVDGQGQSVAGNKGISMFFVKVRDAQGRLNGIEVCKLKNKLGTRQLPTAELLLDGTVAELVSSPGRGIPSIASMLTITRLHNILNSVSYPRRMITLARDYAMKRTAFGQPIAQKVLHAQTLARMEVEIRGCECLMLDIARMIGLDDVHHISDQDSLILRIMTPVAKLYTAKQSVALNSEGLECFGGQGYIEDTGLPGMLRDSQVLPIWEGTSNVMSLDVIRALIKTNGEALQAFEARVSAVAGLASKSNLGTIQESAEAIRKSARAILHFATERPDQLEKASRDLSVSLAHTYIATLLTEHALSEFASESDVVTLRHWLQRDLSPVSTKFSQGVYEDDVKSYQSLVFDGYNPNELFLKA